MIAFSAFKAPAFAPTLGQLGFSFVARQASPIMALARLKQRQQIGKLELGYLGAAGDGARWHPPIWNPYAGRNAASLWARCSTPLNALDLLSCAVDRWRPRRPMNR
jgi:hypothetical protein